MSVWKRKSITEHTLRHTSGPRGSCSCVCRLPLPMTAPLLLCQPITDAEWCRACCVVSCTAQSVSARMWFSSVFSLAFLLFCHEAGVLFVLLIVAANYAIGSLLAGTVWCPLLTWTANALILVTRTLTRRTSQQQPHSRVSTQRDGV